MILSSIVKRGYSIVIIGPPASGKGTISKWLARDFDAVHISTGDLLRVNKLEKLSDRGSLTCDTVVLNLLKEELKKNSSKFCLDGFPRRKSQAESLENILKRGTLETVILLNLPESVLIERITDRWIHPQSGRIYSYSYSPPITKGFDDITGEPLIRRSDDLLEYFEIRLKLYKEHLDSIKEYYQERGILYEFQGENSSEIYSQILQKLHPKYNEERVLKINYNV